MTRCATPSTRPRATPMSSAPLLEVRNLSVSFPQSSETVRAVRGISYTVNEGEFLGIVGESGSGKSVSSMAVMGLLPRNAEITGDVLLRGQSLLNQDDRELSRLRGKEIAMIFQDPLSALTPVYTVGHQIAEGLRLHDKALSEQAANVRAAELLRVVGIPAPERRLTSFPHEFSGGMRQRVMIAIAIANDPQPDHRRRADDRTRRDHPGADPRGAPEGQGDHRRGRRAHHPRPGRGGGQRRPHRRDVRRPAGRDRLGRRRVQPAADALHDRAAALRAQPGHRRTHPARAARGSAPVPVEPASRVPVRATLPDRRPGVHAPPSRRSSSSAAATRRPASARASSSPASSGPPTSSPAPSPWWPSRWPAPRARRS